MRSTTGPLCRVWDPDICTGCRALRNFYIDSRHRKFVARFLMPRWQMPSEDTQKLQRWIDAWDTTEEERWRECLRYGSRSEVPAPVPYVDDGSAAHHAD